VGIEVVGLIDGETVVTLADGSSVLKDDGSGVLAMGTGVDATGEEVLPIGSGVDAIGAWVRGIDVDVGLEVTANVVEVMGLGFVAVGRKAGLEGVFETGDTVL
jgi:hypothetical protein